MGELDYPETTREWLIMRKGIMRRCSLHERDYDAMVGCPGCREERKRESERLAKEKKDRLAGLFDRVIWPQEPPKTD